MDSNCAMALHLLSASDVLLAMFGGLTLLVVTQSMNKKSQGPKSLKMNLLGLNSQGPNCPELNLLAPTKTFVK